MLNKEVFNQDGQQVQFSVNGDLSVTVIKDQNKEWLMTVNDVASGYGVNVQTIHSHLSNHSDELLEGIHYLSAYEIFVSGQRRRMKMLTKAGVIRLGFFIKSERAKMFRDWAEKIVLAVTAPKVELPRTTRRNHNRLSKDRLVEILSLVALVDDKEVRTALVKKLMPSLDVPAVQLQLPLDSGKGGNHG